MNCCNLIPLIRNCTTGLSEIEAEEFRAVLKSIEIRSQEEDNFDTIDSDLDQRIKIAADAMESNLQEIISARLTCLDTVDKEVEKLTSELAEKPSLDQINAMVQDLEKSLSKHMDTDETFQRVLKNIKSGKLFQCFMKSTCEIYYYF